MESEEPAEAMRRLAWAPLLVALEALPLLLFADIVDWARWKTVAVLTLEMLATTALLYRSRSAAWALALILCFVGLMFSYAAGTGALSGWPV